jgi:hypothetical protein
MAKQIYCQKCRRSLLPSAFDLIQLKRQKAKVCNPCIQNFINQGESMESALKPEYELDVKVIMQEREGGETEVETPIGYVDLLTDEEVIEIKHISDWKEAMKVVLYASYFPTRKPRVHLFGGYAIETRKIVEETMKKFHVRVTWERDPF